MEMSILKGILPFLALLLCALPVFSLPELKKVPWIIGPEGRGRLPEWKIKTAANTDDTVTYSCSVNRDWSGYRTLEVTAAGKTGSEIKVTLTDPDDLNWTATAAATGKMETFALPFNSFKPEDQSKDHWLDLALLNSAVVEFHPVADAKASLKSIGLTDSKGAFGPGTNMDVVFKYYQTKPWPDIIQEAKDKGFTCIHVVDVNLQPEGFKNLAKVADAVRNAGLAAILTIYPTTDHVAYEKHPEWRQRALNGSSRYDWRTYLCPNNEGYLAYLDEKLTAAMKSTNFDGLEFAEPWFEIWGGPEEPKVGGNYTCVCEHCREKFKKISGVNPLELFDKNGTHYFRKNPELYEQWIKFRVDTLDTFMNRLFGVARKVHPNIGTFTMQVSDCRVEPGKAREYQGQDFDSMIKNIKPTGMVVESAWQDWLQTDLKPMYIGDYGRYYTPRRGSSTILSQCDIGSSKDCRRGIEWLRVFSSISNKAGFEGYVAYEYSIGSDTTGP